MKSTHTFISEQNVDIYQHPSLNVQHKTTQDTQLTIGDLHANAIKLLCFLIKENIIELKNVSDYSSLANIYKKLPTNDKNQLKKLFIDGEIAGKINFNPYMEKMFEQTWEDYNNQKISVLEKQDLDLFQQILSRIHVKNIPNLIRLMGDETADRGACDLFVLYILFMMHTNKLPYEILLSNHGIEFIIAYENLINKIKAKLEHRFIMDFQVASLTSLQFLLDGKLVTQEALFDLINTAYKPYLKILSYSLSEGNTHITIFSHAAIDLDIIKSLAKKFNVTYNDTTATDLATTIDRINEVFQSYAQQNKIHTICNNEIMDKLSGNEQVDRHQYPREFIMWNRKYDILNRQSVVHPNTPQAYSISFAHAHDSNEPTEKNIINTDNSLGKRGRAEGVDYVLTAELDPQELNYYILSSSEKSLRCTMTTAYDQPVKAEDMELCDDEKQTDIAAFKNKYSNLYGSFVYGGTLMNDKIVKDAPVSQNINSTSNKL